VVVPRLHHRSKLPEHESAQNNASQRPLSLYQQIWLYGNGCAAAAKMASARRCHFAAPTQPTHFFLLIPSHH
jgi:hypothetical protein